MTYPTEIIYNDGGGTQAVAHLDNEMSETKLKLTLTVEELASTLNISKATAYSLVKQKDFYPAFRLGHRILISVQALSRWLDERTGG